jgi:hypothetical protein
MTPKIETTTPQAREQSALASCFYSAVRPVIRQSNGECGVDAPHVFDTTVLPPHPDKRCRCGKQTWKKAETAAFNAAVQKFGHEALQTIERFSPATKPPTSPSETVGRDVSEVASASSPGNQSETGGVNRQPND